MRILWWLFLPCAYLLFYIALTRFLKWASGPDETLDSGSTPEDVQ